MGPSADEENAFLVQERENGFGPSAVPRREEEAEVEAGALPPLEDLVKRIPMPTRDLLEELFRAKFVTVKRLPRSALK